MVVYPLILLPGKKETKMINKNILEYLDQPIISDLEQMTHTELLKREKILLKRRINSGFILGYEIQCELEKIEYLKRINR